MRLCVESVILAQDDLLALAEELSRLVTTLESRPEPDEGGLVELDLTADELDLIERYAGLTLTDFDSKELTEDGREVDDTPSGWEDA